MNPQAWIFSRLHEDTFIERFRPRVNLLNPNATFDLGYGGCLFETYGAELDFIRAQDPKLVWTVVDGDEGQLVIESGFHIVNRLGYLVATAPIEDNVAYTVTLD